MTDHYHPNFPPSLSIIPNDNLSENKVFSEGDDKDAFGAEAQREAISRYGIAGRVWEAAYAMCTYIDTTDDLLDFDPPFVDDLWYEPLGVVELGSGTGVVAANIARKIRRASGPAGFVIATDLPDVCPLLRHNLGASYEREGNSPNSDLVSVRPLTWGNLDHVIAIASEFGFDRLLTSCRLTHIVCSDLVYFPELLGPLLRTLIHLTSLPYASPSKPPVKIVISYKIRSLSKETPFWTAFGLWFSFQPVLVRVRSLESEDASPKSRCWKAWKQFGTEEDADRIFIFVARRRPESVAWHVPESNQELMDGVGARDTRTKKGDDTFETILFMSMGIDNTIE